jgi:D-psicose/D-tagatose/L-ribulose 3-epimerase
MTAMAGKFGVHALMFTDAWTEEPARQTCRAAAGIGFDLIEVLMFDPFALDLGVTRRALSGTGLELRLGLALGPGADISSDDPEIARRGEATVMRALQNAADLGAPGVSGITYAAFASYSEPPGNARRARVVEALGRLGAAAAGLGLRLGIEPVNRYESYLVNTLDEAAALIRDAGSPALFIHMDTFHMNIEEADTGAAIRRNAPLLGYAHVAESHRGVLGTGGFDLTGFFRALAEAGYDGDLTTEAFSGALMSPALVGGVRLWRSAFDDPQAAARTALDAMRAARAAAAGATGIW